MIISLWSFLKVLDREGSFYIIFCAQGNEVTYGGTHLLFPVFTHLTNISESAACEVLFRWG